MRQIRLLALSAGALLLGACGSGPADNQKSGEASTASLLPGAGLPRTACEPRLTGSARDPAAPIDDIVGLRPGQPAADAEAILRCRGNIAELLADDRFHTRNTAGIETRQRLVATTGESCEVDPQRTTYDAYGMRRLPDGCDRLDVQGSRPFRNRDDRFQVALVGMPGQEQVGGVWRTQSFADGAKPVRDQILQTLRAKYGEPNHVREQSNGLSWGWISDLRGRPMSESNPSFANCLGLSPNARHSQQWTSECGQTVAASVAFERTNPELIDQLSIVSMHQAGFMAATERMAADIAARQADERSREVEKARQNAVPVEL